MNKIKTNKKNVLVIFGGKSVEHDISIITGVQTLNAIDKNKYNIIPIYISKDNNWYTSESFFNIKTFANKSLNLSKFKKVFLCSGARLFIDKTKKLKFFTFVDFALLACHGNNGENGQLQGFLDMCNVCYSSPDVLSSAVCMNKLSTKQILQNEGISQVKYISISEEEYKKGFKFIKNKVNLLKFPLIVKPCSLGSSIGITYCKSINKLKNAISFAFLFDKNVLVEQVVNNLKEVNLSIMGNSIEQELSEIEQVLSAEPFLTYESKYLNKKSSAKGMENTSRKIPAEISLQLKEKVKELGLKAFKILNCKGIVRIDFLIDEEKQQVYLNEINTIPGSLSNYLWKDKYSFTKMLDKLIEYSIAEYNTIKNKVTNFNSNVLNQFENSSKLSIKK